MEPDNEDLSYGEKLAGVVDREADDELSIHRLVIAREIDRLYAFQKKAKAPKQIDACKRSIEGLVNVLKISSSVINFQ